MHLYLCSVCPFTYSFVKYCFVILSICLFVSLSLSFSHFFRIPSWPSTLFRDFHFFFCPSNLKSQSLKKKESFIWGVDWWSENFLSQLLQISFVRLIKNKRKYKCHFLNHFNISLHFKFYLKIHHFLFITLSKIFSISISISFSSVDLQTKISKSFFSSEAFDRDHWILFWCLFRF